MLTAKILPYWRYSIVHFLRQCRCLVTIHLFKLDQNLNMTVVAGVPPDYFSLTGQRWGNPHYCWKTMQADGFQWWLNRIRTQNEMFDMVRIDHFRGLQAAWEIPVNKLTANLW